MDFLFSVLHLIKLKYLSVVMLNQMDLSDFVLLLVAILGQHDCGGDVVKEREREVVV